MIFSLWLLATRSRPPAAARGGAPGRPGARRYLLLLALRDRQPLAGRGRGRARGQPGGVGRRVLHVPPADAADVAVRAGAEAPPVAAGPVQQVVTALRLVACRPVGELLPGEAGRAEQLVGEQ